jgi:hypothetical protein
MVIKPCLRIFDDMLIGSLRVASTHFFDQPSLSSFEDMQLVAIRVDRANVH